MVWALALPGPGAAQAATPKDWDAAFPGGTPAVHLTATVVGRDGRAQALEFWRDATGAVVRRTGNAVVLRLTPAPDGEDAYQLRDVAKKSAYDLHRVNCSGWAAAPTAGRCSTCWTPRARPTA